MTTIRDIARKAQVSVSTVSLALNDADRVRPETRLRVLEVMRKLDYRPSRSARSLSSGLTYSIHLLDPLGGQALTSGFLTRFVRGLHDSAKERSYTVAFSIVADDGEAATHTETLISERWTDGIVLLNPSDNSALLELMAQRSFPYVVLGRDPRGRGLSVDNDNRQVGFDAARHLIDAGRTSLAFINGARVQTFARDRAEGFLAAIEEAAAEAGVEGEVYFNEGTPEVAAQLALEAREAGANGLLAASDPQAVSALRALTAAGVRVPHDIALMGMNNDAIGEYVDPPLTSMDLSAYELGREAASLLLDRVEDPLLPAERRLVPHSIAIRESA
ncbi:MAG: LacI family DNA-binding transcriptional regulator [Trueperaceae bacterium]